MALTFNFRQHNGAGNTSTDLGSTGNLANFKANDTAVLSDYSTNQVTASDVAGSGYSMEVWYTFRFSGSGSSVTNIKFWKSTDFSPATGISDKYGVTSSYTTPTASLSAVATGAIPTSVPGSANVSIAGNLAGTLSSFPGDSDYVVLQVHLGSTAAQGDSSLATYSVSYDES